jgi:hypothetical protein
MSQDDTPQISDAHLELRKISILLPAPDNRIGGSVKPVDLHISSTSQNTQIVQEGQGAESSQELMTRAELRLYKRATREGWLGNYPTNEQDRRLVIDTLRNQIRLAVEQDRQREATTAIRALQDCIRDNNNLARDLDKAERLDEGESTENVTFGAIKFRGDRKVETPNGSHPEMEP